MTLQDLLSKITDKKLRAALEKECMALVLLRLEGLRQRSGAGFLEERLKNKPGTGC